MNLIPDLNTAAGANIWSNFWFWISIASLILLGASEVISHKYSLRKDELTAQQEQERNRQHDSDIANLQLQTAQANERAAKSELALEQYKAPRAISEADAEKIRENLTRFSHTKLEILVCSQTLET